jgi:hypothetical protein
MSFINPKNAFIGVRLFFENRQEARKLGLLPPGKSFEAVCERLEPQERVFKGQPDIDDFNCIIWVNQAEADHNSRGQPPICFKLDV